MTTREEVQYALCWNNFNTNMSTGLYDSLCRDDLVDVTLAADGHLARAHRLVLSLSSPYFQKMFTQMPVNQQAFVLLHDCPHTVLKDLIQFMYCGEVNVAPEDLPAFLKVAEGLQIKGLMENADSTTTAELHSCNEIPSSATNDTLGMAAPFDPMTSVSPAEMVIPAMVPAYQQQTPTPTQLGDSTTVTKRTRKRVSEPAATTGAARTTENNRRSSKRQKTRVEVPPSEPEEQFEEEPEEEPEEEEEEEDDDDDEMEENENGDEEYVEDEYNGEADGIPDRSGLGQSYTEADTSVNSTGQAANKKGRGRPSKNAQNKHSNSNTPHQVEFISGPTNRIMLVDQYKFYHNKSGKSTVTWFCRLKQTLGCPARVKSNLDGGEIEFSDLNHNHGVGTFVGRGRSKASLEAVHVKQEPAEKN